MRVCSSPVDIKRKLRVVMSSMAYLSSDENPYCTKCLHIVQSLYAFSVLYIRYQCYIAGV